jgi:hypothetical protein
MMVETMPFRPIQRCISTEPYFVQEIPSESQKRLTYEVHSIWPEDFPGDYTCSCPGFQFKGSCKHQMMAWRDRCSWTEEDPNVEKQTTDQKDGMICPRCGNTTVEDLIDDRY